MGVVRERLRDLRLRILTQGAGSLSSEEALVLCDLAHDALSWQETYSPEDRARLVQAISDLRRLGAM